MGIAFKSIATIVRAGAIFASLPLVNGQVMQRDLTHRLKNGWGNSLTHARATAQTVRDHDGTLRTLLPEEMGVTDGRRVENLAPLNSESVDDWSEVATATVSGKVISLPAEADSAFITFISTGIADRQFIASVTLSGICTTELILQDGVATSQITITLTATPTRYYVAHTGAAASTLAKIRIKRESGQTATSVTIHNYMPEESTGRIDTITPSEYVSIGVLSAPYHGANVDGVAWFDFDNGNTVAANIVTEIRGTDLPNIKGAFLEKASQNQALQSEDLGTTWTPVNATVSIDMAVAPNGETSADSLIEDVTNTLHRIYSNNHARSATVGTWSGSVYVKKKDYDTFQLRLTNGSSSKRVTAIFNLVTGEITAVTNVTWTNPIATIVDIGDGWWRCKLTGTTDAVADGARLHLYLSNSSYTGDGTSGTYFWGMQFEENNYATSYIKTTTASASRVESQLHYSSKGIPVNNLTGSINWTPAAAGQGEVFILASYVDANNYTAIMHDGTNIIARKRIAGVNYDATKALTYVADTTYRIDWRFDSIKGIDVFIDGTGGANHSNTTDCQIGATYEIGSDGNGAGHQCGSVKLHRVYPIAFTDEQIAA